MLPHALRVVAWASCLACAADHAAIQAVENPPFSPIEPSVGIVVSPAKAGPAPLRVTLRAEVLGLTPPLRFHWSLGDGRESDEPDPPGLVYRVGRYDVVLTVTDAEGRVKKASVTIDAQPRGC